MILDEQPDYVPMPIKWGLSALREVGFPVAVCAVLLWVVLGLYVSKLDAMSAALTDHARHVEVESSVIRHYMWALCINGAQDERQRANCAMPAADR